MPKLSGVNRVKTGTELLGGGTNTTPETLSRRYAGKTGPNPWAWATVTTGPIPRHRVRVRRAINLSIVMILSSAITPVLAITELLKHQTV
jgi:hypothetical protein